MITRVASLLLLASGGSLCATTDADHAARMAESLELFSNQVRGTLSEHCVRCHGGEKTRSAFDLTNRKGLLAGGDQGVAVVAGKPGQSPLLDYLRHREEPHMPPKSPPLSADAIASIEQWIELGAAYDKPLVTASASDSGPMEVTEEERAFWAVARLRRDFGDKRDIYDFIQTTRDAACGRVLSRRLFFDLTGLPPDPDVVDRFAEDESEEAYGILV